MSHLVHSVVNTTEAPAPVGAYSQGRQIGPFLRVSGQMGLAAEDQSVAGQTRVALANVGVVLAEAGASWADVLSVQVFLSSDELFDEFDRAYSDVLTTPFPARTTVSCELAPGALVEIDALAVLAS